MSEAEKDTREWLIDIDREGKVVGERPWTVWMKVIVVPKSALTAALEERDALREKWAAYGAGGARRENELEADLERAEAALAAEGDPLCVCQDTGARAIKGACPEHHGDACLINLPGYCIRATEDREARFRAEAALAEALDVIEAVVAGIVTLDGARVVLRKHGRLP